MDANLMRVTSIGSNCAIEHAFDVTCQHWQSKYFTHLLGGSGFNLIIKDTPLTGSYAHNPDTIINALSNVQDFSYSLRVSSNKKWICSDKYDFVIHNGWSCRPMFGETQQDEMQTYMFSGFDLYCDIDVFLYSSWEMTCQHQMQKIYGLCKKFNPNCKMIFISNLTDYNDGQMINVNCDQIYFGKYWATKEPSRYTLLYNEWSIPVSTMNKLKSIYFDERLFLPL